MFNGAESSRASIQWSEEVQNDFANYFETGATPISTSTPAPVTTSPVVTVTPDTLVEPSTPVLPDPDSAVTTYVSMVVLSLAVLANLIL